MPTIADLLARPAGRVILAGASGARLFVDYRAHAGTPARLAIMVTANALTDDIRDLAMATQADTEQQPGKVARAVAKSFARRTVRQYV